MAGFDLESAMAAVTFAGVRVSGVMLFAPLFNHTAMPPRVKAGFAFGLTVLLYPVYRGQTELLTGSHWVASIAGELVVGIMLGLTLQFFFEAAQLAGHICGVQAGFALATLFDPQSQADSPALAILFQLVALLCLLQLNVHHWVLRGLGASFRYLPPGGLQWHEGALHSLVHAAGAIWLAGVQLAAPVIAATLALDIGLGFLARAAPQMPVLYLGISLKGVLGLSVLVGALRFWPSIWESYFARGVAMGERLLHLAGN